MPGLSLVDENYGQLENIDNANTDMYPITFPAVLIDLQEATWSNLADRSQKGTIKVNVQLLIDCYDDTHYDSGTMEAIKERAAMVEELHRLLQGYRPKEDGASRSMIWSIRLWRPMPSRTRKQLPLHVR